MAMDVYGRKPTTTKGEYFGANVWAWRPIHVMMIELCHDLLSDELLSALAFNNGEGPTGQHICTKIADRFDAWLSNHEVPEDVTLESPDFQVDKTGRFVSEEEQQRNPNLETRSPYRASRCLLKQWVQFLRHCGGFEVW